MNIVGPLLRSALKPLASYLNQPCGSYAPVVATNLDLLSRALLPGDVILVEGNTRFASLVRVLTQSTWSHVAMFVGPLESTLDPECIVEADVERGVRTLPLSELRGMNARAVRASGLDAHARAEVSRRVLARVGQLYDVDCAVELARSLWSIRRGQPRLRPDPAPVAAAERAICSTLLAQAFEAVGYPILPGLLQDRGAPARARVYTPRDFDLSPFFTVVPAPEPHPPGPQATTVPRAGLGQRAPLALGAVPRIHA
jgi:hypothetical protein